MKPYPLSAVWGQGAMQRALLLGAIDPRLGGVLIAGARGAAKSRAARALAALLPRLQIRVGCPYGCAPEEECDHAPAGGGVVERPAPFVSLPLGASEDRVVGSLHLEEALRAGRRRFEPGLLARAHRGVLYVDEVNLLPDHLVDLLLDAAASGVHTVEREGISELHPARFLLVGTMNPEEGELRPQLLDRFGLSAGVETVGDIAARVEIANRAIAYERDPEGFAAVWASREEELRRRLAAAREKLAEVAVSPPVATALAERCAAAGVEGLRADIAMRRAAAAFAALEGRGAVEEGDVDAVAELVLAHRRGETGPPPASGPPTPNRRPNPTDGSGRLGRDAQEPPPPPPGGGATPPPPGGADGGGGHPEGQGEGATGTGARLDRSPSGVDPPRASTEAGRGDGDRSGGASPTRGGEPLHFDPGPVLRAALPRVAAVPNRPRRLRERVGVGGGRGTSSDAGGIGRGPAVRALPARGIPRELALAATLRAAAAEADPLGGGEKGSSPSGGRRGPQIAAHHLREWQRRPPPRQLYCFCLDASRSMGARRRMEVTQGALLGLLASAYQKRIEIALVVFQGRGARLVLPPTRSVRRAAGLLRGLRVAGRTPLAAGLARAGEVVRGAERRTLGLSCSVVLVSDGRASPAARKTQKGGDPLVAVEGELAALRAAGISLVFVDTEEGVVRLGLMRNWALRFNSPCLDLDDLDTRSAAARRAPAVVPAPPR